MVKYFEDCGFIKEIVKEELVDKFKKIPKAVKQSDNGCCDCLCGKAEDEKETKVTPKEGAEAYTITYTNVNGEEVTINVTKDGDDWRIDGAGFVDGVIINNKTGEVTIPEKLLKPNTTITTEEVNIDFYEDVEDI